MLWLIIVILFLAWILGAFVFAVGSFIHLLLLVIIVVIVYRLMGGRDG